MWIWRRCSRPLIACQCATNVDHFVWLPERHSLVSSPTSATMDKAISAVVLVPIYESGVARSGFVTSRHVMRHCYARQWRPRKKAGDCSAPISAKSSSLGSCVSAATALRTSASRHRIRSPGISWLCVTPGTFQVVRCSANGTNNRLEAQKHSDLAREVRLYRIPLRHAICPKQESTICPSSSKGHAITCDRLQCDVSRAQPSGVLQQSRAPYSGSGVLVSGVTVNSRPVWVGHLAHMEMHGLKLAAPHVPSNRNYGRVAASGAPGIGNIASADHCGMELYLRPSSCQRQSRLYGECGSGSQHRRRGAWAKVPAIVPAPAKDQGSYVSDLRSKNSAHYLN